MTNLPSFMGRFLVKQRMIVDTVAVKLRGLICELENKARSIIVEDHVTFPPWSWSQPLPSTAAAAGIPALDVGDSNGVVQDRVLWMAVPKKRTSHSKKRMRMTHKWLKPVHHYTYCQNCGSPKLLHMLCGLCFRQTMSKTAEYRRSKEKQKMLQREKKRLKIESRAANDGEHTTSSPDQHVIWFSWTLAAKTYTQQQINC